MNKIESKEAIQKNQDLLEKVLKDNEDLLVLAETYKQQIEHAKFSLQKCQTETMQSIEPQVKKLLDEHQANLEVQNKEYKKKIELAQTRFQAEKEKLQKQHDEKRALILKEHQEKLENMKQNALSKENHLKASYKEELSSFPSKIQQAHDEEAKILESQRIEWQQMISSQLRSEYEAEAANEAKKSREKQNKVLEEIIGKLQADAHEENIGLEMKLKELKELNRNEELSIHRDEENLLSEIKKIKSDISQKEDQIKRYQDKISQCKCTEYKIQIDKFKMRIQDIKSKIEEVYKIQEKEQENTIQMVQKNQQQLLQFQQDFLQIQQEYNNKKEQSQKQIQALEDKHREEMILLGNRVKQAIGKKDQIIQQLMIKIESLGDPTLLAKLNNN